MKIGAILLTIGILGMLGKLLSPDPNPGCPPPPTAKKVAVYGRTLWPTPPPMIVINKRTSLSGEGVFKFKPLSAAHLK